MYERGMKGTEKGNKEAVETNVVHSGLFDTIIIIIIIIIIMIIIIMIIIIMIIVIMMMIIMIMKSIGSRNNRFPRETF